jgi:hypothetical protein
VLERDSSLRWTLDVLDDANPKAEIEFAVEGEEEDSFYPVVVSFEANEIVCPAALAAVAPAGEESVEIPEVVVKKRLVTYKYEIE